MMELNSAKNSDADGSFDRAGAACDPRDARGFQAGFRLYQRE